MKPEVDKKGSNYFLGPFLVTLLMAVIFFLASGRLDVFRAWITFGLNFIGGVIGAILKMKFAPELAKQRRSAKQGTHEWDMLILLMYFSLVLMLIPFVAGLDVGRFRWSHLNFICAAVGIVLYAAFIAIFHWAMVINEHFEGTARIQKDRNQKVITEGPYRVIRHPGYLAMIFLSFADSSIIGSRYALIPSLLAAMLIIVRTSLEDKMLRNGLEGYLTYCNTVKYRLIPGIW